MLKAILKAMPKAKLRVNCKLPTGCSGDLGVIHEGPSLLGLPLLFCNEKPRGRSERGTWGTLVSGTCVYKASDPFAQNKLEPL